MFTVNDDLSIYLTRGDTLFFNVRANDHGYPYTFKPGDIVRISVTAKKDVTDVYIQKDFPVYEACKTVFVYLEGRETKIGDKINKYRDYWYEIVLNPDTVPQTIIGNNDDGAKILRLFPEADDVNKAEVLPEEIPVVDGKLDMTSDRPVSNRAVTAAIARLTAAIEQLKGNMPSGEEPDGSVFNALGQVEGLSVLVIDAYGIAVKHGFEGTVEEWLASLKGEKGDTGNVDFEALTEEQIAQLRGDPFTYDDFTPEQLAALKGDDGYTPIKGKDYNDGTDGKSAYQYAKEAGYTGTEAEFAEKLADDTSAVDSKAVNELIDTKLHSVTTYGAKGDGSTDDTQAFQNALAENRVVTVPGGTYILSGALVIRENCCLELSQDTVLKFTQTSGYAIEMRSSATLRGNHAIISVPYEFTGSVIAMDTVNDGEDHNSIPPYTKAGSNMFKRQRFIYDVNIIKPDSVGFCRSMDGNCNGTAIYMSAEGTASFRWMWGITMSGIRIAGGFSYGIRAANFDKPGDYEDNAWNHDMRIEAVIEACEIGVSLENCNGAHLAVTIQPYKAQNNGAIYAKHGVYLNDARFIDMIGSRVWDWNASNTLWTSGGQYQHLALIGNCRGLILDDFLVYESSVPIRDLIYTDTPGNFDKMTILQEPGNKWFKAIDGEPYFNDGNSDIRLAAKTDIDEYFVTDRIADFTDVLKTSIDKNGNIYGTASGYYDSKFDVLSPSAYHIHTGFIACKKGDTFYTDGVKIRDEGNVRVTFFDSEFNYITNVSGKNMIAGNYYVDPIVSTERGFQLTVKNINDANINNIAYARFNFYASDVGDNPVMTVNEEIKYTQAGFLADGIKVKAENVIGGSAGGGISVTGAKVGQTVKISEVDETGKPTAWEPTDFPSGGGGANWKKVVDVTMTEAVTEIVIDTDKDGKPFNLWFARYCIYIPKNNENAADTTSVWLYVNDYEDAFGRTIHSLTATKNNDRHIIGDAAVVGEQEKTNGGSFTQQASPYISCIKIYCKTNGNFFPAGTRIWIAGIPTEGGNS